MAIPLPAAADPVVTYYLQQGVSGYTGFDDTSIFNESTNAGGGTDGIFSGTNNQLQIRRALIKADFSQIPPQAVILNAELHLVVESSGGNFGNVNYGAHRLINDWGEGSVVGNLEGGFGGPPGSGDATWVSNHHLTSAWTTSGGDYIATASDTSPAGQAGATAIWDGPGIVADVQGWVNGSLPNHGWALVSSLESTKQRVKKFHSSEAIANRPMLVVTADLAAAVPIANPPALFLLFALLSASGCFLIARGRHARARVDISSKSSTIEETRHGTSR